MNSEAKTFIAITLAKCHHAEKKTVFSYGINDWIYLVYDICQISKVKGSVLCLTESL